MLAEMTSKQVVEWMAYFKIEIDDDKQQHATKTMLDNLKKKRRRMYGYR